LAEDFGIQPELFWRVITADHFGLSGDLRRVPGKRFESLWRGGRDGFGAKEFHRRCDGHANTLTVILDTEGNIFGGFTPVEWKSLSDNCYKADDSEKSFLFTLKNPHNFPAKRFGLNVKPKHCTIWCDSQCGPCFGAGGNFFFVRDIHVSDNCNTQTKSSTDYFRWTYINDIGRESQTFFMGSESFQEIEVNSEIAKIEEMPEPPSRRQLSFFLISES
jgi:hypothetical protein